MVLVRNYEYFKPLDRYVVRTIIEIVTPDIVITNHIRYERVLYSKTRTNSYMLLPVESDGSAMFSL